MKPQTYFETFLHAVFYSLLTAAAAQFQVNIFSPAFSVSLGIVFLAVFSMLSEHIPLLFVSVLSGFFVLLSRIFYGCLNGSAFTEALGAYFPELGFYLVYGACLFFYLKKFRRPGKFFRNFPALFLCDYVANFAELMLRLDIDAFSLSSQLGILFAAFLRTILVLLFVTLFRRYHLILIRREEKDYYQNLTLLTSRLQEEVLWMKKNTAIVESSMRGAYQLFEQLRSDEKTKSEAGKALAVANDIHEIKKEYYLILRGLDKALSTENSPETIRFSDIFSILEKPVKQFASDLGRTVDYQFHIDTSARTGRQYCLLSVFRNLFMNAIEASNKECVRLCVTAREEGGEIFCTVTDDGPGIPEDNLPLIFDAGFSTKINYETGEISRGLGLNIVRDMVEQKLGGTIHAISRPGETTFSMKFKKLVLEENK